MEMEDGVCVDVGEDGVAERIERGADSAEGDLKFENSKFQRGKGGRPGTDWLAGSTRADEASSGGGERRSTDRSVCATTHKI